jgi:dienelactone hydrolase
MKPQRVFALLAALLSGALALAAEIPKGRVLEKVTCASDQNQTYALYIPTTFDPAKKSPALFCFDPGARGKNPVERFQAAAEKFGWIVAGSNNSRNGPWEANAAAIQAMVGDVTRHLPVDPKRLYVAGLSGGARVACQIAMGGLAQGVIACSAAFSGGEAPGKVPFLFFGTAGVTDFNYRELRRVDRELYDRKAAHRVVIFDGGHEWLPPHLALEALAWLELQAMRRGSREKDAGWIEAQLAERSAAVAAAPPVERQRALRSLTQDFKGLADIVVFEKEAAALAATREVRDALKAERALENREDTLVEDLLAAVGEGFVGSARKTAAELQAKAKSSPDPAERAMATRVLQGVASSCGEGARAALRANDYETAAPLLELVTVLRPERAQGQVELARARAALGDRKRALTALEAAVAAGFKDVARLETEKDFDRLRKDPAFAAFIERMKAAQQGDRERPPPGR